MARGDKRVCKICGKEYDGCHTQRPYANGEFRWQDVACCPEHGQEYLRQIMISRGQLQPEVKPEEAPAEPAEEQDAQKLIRRKKKTSEEKTEE